jgi:hypothetical protein
MHPVHAINHIHSIAMMQYRIDLYRIMFVGINKVKRLGESPYPASAAKVDAATACRFSLQSTIACLFLSVVQCKDGPARL